MKANRTRNLKRSDRRGTAVVELAVVMPILLLFIMGIIQVGQFSSVGQVATNASRIGGRHAAKASTTTAAQVQTAVRAYLTQAFPTVPAATINAWSITVTNSGGSTVTNLSTINTNPGDHNPVNVTVTIPFNDVRWKSFTNFSFMTNRSLVRTTQMRRE